MSATFSLCVRATGKHDSHLVPGTRAMHLIDRSHKRRRANAYSWRWRGVGLTNFAARSRELRDALKEHGWDESVIGPWCQASTRTPPCSSDTSVPCPPSAAVSVFFVFAVAMSMPRT